METPRVLVVDDSRVVRKIVEMTLWREHIEVVTATDGLGALAAVTIRNPISCSWMSFSRASMGTKSAGGPPSSGLP